MKVLMINGSSRKNGCTFLALSEIAKVLKEQNIETEIIQMGANSVRDCIGCNGCSKKGYCVFKDNNVNEILDKARESDGFVFGTPVYYAHPSGQLLSLLDRLFYAGKDAFLFKPGASVVTARRAGTSASLDVINKYMTNAQMPVVSSTYWNMVFGPSPDLILQDKEGLQTMRNLGRNMAWILHCIEDGKNNGHVPPQNESQEWTNFNR